MRPEDQQAGDSASAMSVGFLPVSAIGLDSPQPSRMIGMVNREIVMRFALCALALVMAAPAGAVTIYTGTLTPVDGFVSFFDEKAFGATDVAQVNRLSFSISNGVIVNATASLLSAFSYDEFSAEYPGVNDGNNYWTNDGCFFNTASPDGCFSTDVPPEFGYKPNYLNALSVDQRSLSFNVLQPRQFNDCEPGSVGRCSFFWDAALTTEIKIASYRPVSYRLSIDTRNAVPEPSSWAMMLLGFGGIGVALRNRKATTAPA
ncbi:MAG: PEPxxWA-CTERM sorting domain-containing protein [Sphingomonadaceae bacterium]